MNELNTAEDWSRHLMRAALAASVVLTAIGAVYVVTAYEFVPSAWRWVERRHPALDSVGPRTSTSAGIPGDPLNVGFVGSESALQSAMRDASWFPADAITLKSSMRIAVDSVTHKPYPDAPVSDLFVNGKRQDLAFEQAEEGSPSKRHHVRFWLAQTHDAMDRPLWIGAATFDSGVGLSHRTGQITHHIAAEVDRERDKLVEDLQRHGNLVVRWIDSFQPEHEGRNGGGDRYVTDGRLALCIAS